MGGYIFSDKRTKGWNCRKGDNIQEKPLHVQRSSSRPGLEGLSTGNGRGGRRWKDLIKGNGCPCSTYIIGLWRLRTLWEENLKKVYAIKHFLQLLIKPLWNGGYNMAEQEHPWAHVRRSMTEGVPQKGSGSNAGNGFLVWLHLGKCSSHPSVVLKMLLPLLQFDREYRGGGREPRLAGEHWGHTYSKKSFPGSKVSSSRHPAW